MERKQITQKERHDLRARKRELMVGDNVFVRNYHQGLPGVIKSKTGPVSHQDQLRRRTVTFEYSGEVASPSTAEFIPEIVMPDCPVATVPSSINNPVSLPPDVSSDVPSANDAADSGTHDAEPTVETPDSSNTMQFARSIVSVSKSESCE